MDVTLVQENKSDTKETRANAAFVMASQGLGGEKWSG